MKNRPIHSKADLCRWSLAALVLAVQACGGGGSDGTSAGDTASSSGAPAAAVPPAPAPAAATPTPSPAPAPTPAPTPAPAPAPAPTPVAAAPAPVPAPAPAPTPAPAPASSSALIELSAATTCSIPGMREAILAQVNAARAAGRVCGTEIMPAVAAMKWNDVLFSAAARHSQDMASRNYFSHTSPEGVTFSQRLANEGYVAWAGGENIAAGPGTVSGVMATWLSSEGHCHNIMQPVLTEVAVACVSQSGSSYGTYWTMDLGGR